MEKYLKQLMAEFNFLEFPDDNAGQQKYWQTQAQNIISQYTDQKTGNLFGCQPNLAIKMPAAQVIYILSKRFSDEKVRFCINPLNCQSSPLAENTDSSWIKNVAMVGVNIRTIGTFWNLVKYALTLPKHISSIHLLPIWEPGVVASLYGIASWHINTEFYDYELATQFPHLNTVENQLKIVINILHLMGKTVGFDVVPHTDRYSEISLANPYHFEWLQRKNFDITDHSQKLVDKVAERIVEFVNINGSKSGDYFPRNFHEFFDNSKHDEGVRLRILFGKKEDKDGRNARRNQLINFLFEKGYEPVPATMAPPYRGLVVNPSESAKTVDNEGRVWRDYAIEKPEKMSRVFGPLARYKLYESKDDNKNWELNFDKPRTHVYEYVAQKYEEVCQKYNFDFMRGDMSHVQMNPQVSDNQINEYYDIHKYVKNYIKKSKPYFAYFAESFLVEDNLMAYGNEAEHLNRSGTDSTLGNLQSYALIEPDFYKEFIQYYNLAKSNNFAPNFTVFTADKDDPRFDIFYLEGNEIRYFLATFFTYFPSYSSLGFEIRDLHYSPAPNEHYTKLYVFQMENGPNSTHGPYCWGKNAELFKEIQKINELADHIFVEHESPKFDLLCKIDEFNTERILIWQLTFSLETYIFITALAIPEKGKVLNLKDLGNVEDYQLYNANLNKNGILLKPFSYGIFRVKR